MSLPRSAHWPAVSDAFLYCSEAVLPQVFACSPIAPRSSDPAFGARSMPRPAPSTVPVNRPIMNPPPLLSLSYRSKLSAIVLLPLCEVRSVKLKFDVSGVLRPPVVVQQVVNRGARGVHERQHPPHARRHARRRAADRVVDALGAIAHPPGHVLDVDEDAVDARHQ